MQSSVYDLKKFYNGKMGRVVRRIMQERIRRFWPEMNKLNMLGIGYATPYMRTYRPDVERMTALMTPEMGGIHWPHDGRNCTAVARGISLPIETNSIDRLLVIHHLEYVEYRADVMRELWRVLKSNGRMLVIVPNRAGLWAHADWSPFGHGTPYSWSQICKQLKEHKFIIERGEEALFLPPVKYSPLIKSAGFLEKFGSRFLPIAAGVHMIEVSKQIYAKMDADSGMKAPARLPEILLPKPKPVAKNKH